MDETIVGVEPTPEVTDQKSELIKRTINGVGLSVETLHETATKEILTMKGVVSGLVAAGTVIQKVQGEAQAEIDAQKLDGDVAKMVLQWLQKGREALTQAMLLNQRELAVREGKVMGLKAAMDQCEQLFRQEDMKIRLRENEARRGNRDEGGRPLPIRQVRGEAPPEEPTPVSPEPAPPKKRGRRTKA